VPTARLLLPPGRMTKKHATQMKVAMHPHKSTPDGRRGVDTPSAPKLQSDVDERGDAGNASHSRHEEGKGKVHCDHLGHR
jgi:hypothetical protein